MWKQPVVDPKQQLILGDKLYIYRYMERNP